MILPAETDLHRLAADLLGFDRLHDEQSCALEALQQGQDVLAILRTGGGKSAIYQLGGALLGGLTVVISPLIALQADQHAGMSDSGLPDAALLNSHTPAAERREIIEKIRRGSLGYLLLAPEQLFTGDTLTLLQEHPPRLLVIDEAHCVSEWGHDFRPDYTRLDTMIDALEPRPQVLALTATASPDVRDDVLAQLNITDATVCTGPVDRPNLRLSAEICPDQAVKDRLIRSRVLEALVDIRGVGQGETPEGTAVRGRVGIVYVRTQANTEHVQALLADEGVESVVYRGGLGRAARDEAFDAFMGGRVNIVIATNAFGMGVDKPDVRWVFHYDVPDSLDSYFQEIGRAGRDGGDAVANLFYTEADLGRQKSMSAPVRLEVDHVETVLEELAEGAQAEATDVAAPGESLDSLQEDTGLGAGRLERTVQLLDELDVVERTVDDRLRPDVALAELDPETAQEIAEEVVEQQDRFRDWRKHRLEQMRVYAETCGCRRAVLLRYFGEEPPPTCGHCDNCRSGAAAALVEVEEVEEEEEATVEGDVCAVDAEVEHTSFGVGRVTAVGHKHITVLFRDVGEKRLNRGFVEANEALKRR